MLLIIDNNILYHLFDTSCHNKKYVIHCNCVHIWVGHTSELSTGAFSSQVHDHIVEEVHQPNIMKHTVICYCVIIDPMWIEHIWIICDSGADFTYKSQATWCHLLLRLCWSSYTWIPSPQCFSLPDRTGLMIVRQRYSIYVQSHLLLSAVNCHEMDLWR